MLACLLAPFLFLSYASSAVLYPDSDSTVVELPSTEPGVYKFRVTETSDTGAGQADAYTQPALGELYPRLITEFAPLKDLLAKTYTDYGCDADGTYVDDPSSPELDNLFCGSVSPVGTENTVLWSNGRAGWMAAGATYKSILTFRSDGSGHFTSPAMEILTSVDVGASKQTFQDDEPASFDVTIDFRKFTEIVER